MCRRRRISEVLSCCSPRPAVHLKQGFCAFAGGAAIHQPIKIEDVSSVVAGETLPPEAITREAECPCPSCPTSAATMGAIVKSAFALLRDAFYIIAEMLLQAIKRRIHAHLPFPPVGGGYLFFIGFHSYFTLFVSESLLPQGRQGRASACTYNTYMYIPQKRRSPESLDFIGFEGLFWPLLGTQRNGVRYTKKRGTVHKETGWLRSAIPQKLVIFLWCNQQKSSCHFPYTGHNL